MVKWVGTYVLRMNNISQCIDLWAAQKMDILMTFTLEVYSQCIISSIWFLLWCRAPHFKDLYSQHGVHSQKSTKPTSWAWQNITQPFIFWRKVSIAVCITKLIVILPFLTSNTKCGIWCRNSTRFGMNGTMNVIERRRWIHRKLIINFTTTLRTICCKMSSNSNN